jgi:small subunit ribosomal protein S3
MAQKVHPVGFRLGSGVTWQSRWFNDTKARLKYIEEDYRLRKFLQKKLRNASVGDIYIERTSKRISITVIVGKPGLVIGKSGQGVDDLTKEIKRTFFGSAKIDVKLHVKEASKANLDSRMVFNNLRDQIERRMVVKRAMKQAVESVMQAGAKGVKVIVSGRLNGADIARSEMLVQGKVPLQTIRSGISYTSDFARTIYGVIGIKVWVYTGEKFDKQ